MVRTNQWCLLSSFHQATLGEESEVMGMVRASQRTGRGLARGFSFAEMRSRGVFRHMNLTTDDTDGHGCREVPFRWLGRVSYADGLRLQEELLVRHLAGENADTILLLEHESVFTIGRTTDRSSLGELKNLPAPLVEIGRGGKATWHGPGQLVGYPVLNLARYGSDLHYYLRALEQALIDGCRALGVAADRREGLTGVWVENRKLASIGVGARHWISQHGFALNVCGGLEGFAAITPCGIDGVVMTSLEREGATLSVAAAAQIFGEQVSRCLVSLTSP